MCAAPCPPGRPRKFAGSPQQSTRAASQPARPPAHVWGCVNDDRQRHRAGGDARHRRREVERDVQRLGPRRGARHHAAQPCSGRDVQGFRVSVGVGAAGGGRVTVCHQTGASGSTAPSTSALHARGARGAAVPRPAHLRSHSRPRPPKSEIKPRLTLRGGDEAGHGVEEAPGLQRKPAVAARAHGDAERGRGGGRAAAGAARAFARQVGAQGRPLGPTRAGAGAGPGEGQLPEVRLPQGAPGPSGPWARRFEEGRGQGRPSPRPAQPSPAQATNPARAPDAEDEGGGGVSGVDAREHRRAPAGVLPQPHHRAPQRGVVRAGGVLQPGGGGWGRGAGVSGGQGTGMGYGLVPLSVPATRRRAC